MNPFPVIISVGVGLIAANFLYQAAGQHDWAVATERSFFQFAALLGVGISLAIQTWATR